MSSHTESLDSMIERRKELILRCKTNNDTSDNTLSVPPDEFPDYSQLTNKALEFMMRKPYRYNTNFKRYLTKPWRTNRILHRKDFNMKRMRNMRNSEKRRENESDRHRDKYSEKPIRASSVTSVDEITPVDTRPSPLLKTFSASMTNLNDSQETEAERTIFNYCLDREVQLVICRIQNEFKTTERYKNFMLSEMPFIHDFRPSPDVSSNKLNDRFKCMFKQLLDFENLSFMDELVDH